MGSVSYAVVIPTVGRTTLNRAVVPLLNAGTDGPEEIIIVDDRCGRGAGVPVEDRPGVRVLRSNGRGPAAARDIGWRAGRADWIVFLDDDVVPPADWTDRLTADLCDLPFYVGGSQGRIHVPQPEGRRPTDAEHGVLALADARWITADMAYRRSVLEEAGGFDRRFHRAYREDTDIALRVRAAGYGLVRGERVSVHPLRDAGLWSSVRAQQGNSDDVLMRRLHGRRWRERVAEPPGRLSRHVLSTSALGAAAVTGTLAARSTTGRRAAVAMGLLWGALTAEFIWHRVARGPRTPAETARMVLTSVAIPPVACYHRIAGEVRHRAARQQRALVPRAVLFDRDGTLVHDVPYNSDPDNVRPMAQARAALERVRGAGVRVGVVSNQSGVARGLISQQQLDSVNARVEKLLGPFDVWHVCVHAAEDGCGCRKPRAGLIEAAAAELGIAPQECVVIGDIGADVDAAQAAGARAILVPNGRTRRAERRAAPEVAETLIDAVERALRGEPV